MPVGEGFSSAQEKQIAHVVREADRRTGLRFSVYVGGVGHDDPREYALRLLAALGDSSAISVLVVVDPSRRALEIVTGPAAASALPDSACAAVAASMAAAFGASDLTGGITTGVEALADRVRHPASLE